MATKGKGLTLAILLGKGKKSGGESDGGTEMGHDEPDYMSDADDGEKPEDETDDELPDGLVEAVSEFRNAESDEDAAKALYNAIRCC